MSLYSLVDILSSSRHKLELQYVFILHYMY